MAGMFEMPAELDDTDISPQPQPQQPTQQVHGVPGQVFRQPQPVTLQVLQQALANNPSLERSITQEGHVIGPDLAQDVTQYCPVQGCPYSSFKTSDTNLLETCFKQILLNLKIVHGISDNNNGDAGGDAPLSDKCQREYQAATKTRTVRRTCDDAVFNLCEARFFSAPLDLNTLGQNMPVTNTPVNTVIDYSHLGVDVTSKETLRKLHNRAVTTIRLRDLSDSNLRSFHAAGDEMVAVKHEANHLQLSKKQKHLEDPKECLKAYYNYAAICRQIHTLDWSPMALLKVALDKFFVGPPTVDQYCKFFERFVSINAVKAQKSAVPLTYTDIAQIWVNYITPNPMSDFHVGQLVEDKIRQMGGGRKPPGPTPVTTGPPKRQKLLLTRDDYCQDWNLSLSPPLCPNQQAQGGCMLNGKFLKHACSRKMGNRRCGSDKHGYNNH